MDTRYGLHIAPKDTAAGAVPEVQTDGAITLFCVAVIAVCFVAPLLMTLSQTLDAAASPAPLIRETLGERRSQTAAAAPLPTFHERHPLPATNSWVDTLDETELAAWRLRASD